MANRLELEFRGLEELMQRIDASGGSMKEAADEALLEAKRAVTPGIQREIGKHRRTGKTEASLDGDMTVSWVGFEASVDIGFHVRQGGLPSIFLMYGTPRVKPDRALYNSIYGNSAREAIYKAEEKALHKYLEKVVGGN